MTLLDNNILYDNKSIDILAVKEKLDLDISKADNERKNRLNNIIANLESQIKNIKSEIILAINYNPAVEALLARIDNTKSTRELQSLKSRVGALPPGLDKAAINEYTSTSFNYLKAIEDLHFGSETEEQNDPENETRIEVNDPANKTQIEVNDPANETRIEVSEEQHEYSKLLKLRMFLVNKYTVIGGVVSLVFSAVVIPAYEIANKIVHTLSSINQKAAEMMVAEANPQELVLDRLSMEIQKRLKILTANSSSP